MEEMREASEATLWRLLSRCCWWREGLRGVWRRDCEQETDRRGCRNDLDEFLIDGLARRRRIILKINTCW